MMAGVPGFSGRGPQKPGAAPPRYDATPYVTANSTAATSLANRESKSPEDARAKNAGGSASSFCCSRRRNSATTRCPSIPMQ